VLGKFNFIPINIETISRLIFFYALFYCFVAIYKFKIEDRQNAFNHYKKILKFSFKLMISTFLIFLITSSGRIIVEYFFNFEAVGVYAFYFRLSAVVVMIHQIINIAFFKKMYTLDPQILDKYFNLFYIVVFIISLSIFFIAPFVVKNLSTFFNDTYSEHKPLYFLLSAQMVMWIATALNSNIIDRENVVGKNNVRFIILIFLTIISFYLFQNILTIDLLTYIHYTAIYIACMVQYYSLSKKEIYFIKSTIALTITFLFTSCFYFIFI
jgi:O-antigen/teichoic acid export membrane protein